MADEIEVASAMKMATDIIIAYLGGRTVEPEQLAPLVREIRTALLGEASANTEATSNAAGHDAPSAARAEPEATRPKPAVPIDQSITPDYLISLEDGQRYRTLRRHLMAKYQMTADDYRKKWGLPAAYPMVAPNYAEERSKVAKRTGLGRNKPTPAAKAG